MKKENDIFEAVIEGVAQQAHHLQDHGNHDGVLEPCTLVIIGASGDLTARKLVPALYTLSLHNGLPYPFVIVGCSRTALSDDEFRERMKKALSRDVAVDQAKWEAFSRHLFYHHVEYDDLSAYMSLAKRLDVLDEKFKIEGRRIFYLAIPPTLYETTARMLGQASLSREDAERGTWSRIVVEKPFGRDLASAKALNRRLLEHWEED